MTIVERITADMVASQKAGKTEELATLRLLINALKNQAKDLRKETLDDNEAIKVLQKEVKKRKESILAFGQGGRQDLVDKEQAEIALLQPYLPAEIADQELDALINKAIASSGLQAPYDFGRLMGAVMKEVGGKADGQRVRAAIQKIVDAS